MAKQILLADDSITIQKVVELTFSDSEYKVTSVSGGGQALAKVRESRPDIILCDVIMPEKNGYEVTEALKSSPATKAIPIILLSGTFEPFDEERARRVGADDWITKPFESQQLIAKVEELLKKRIMVPESETGAPAGLNLGPMQGKMPNPDQGVSFAQPSGMTPPPAPPAAQNDSPVNTLPPVFAAPPPFPAPAPVPAVGASPFAPEPTSLAERRQAITQEMSRSGGASVTSPEYAPASLTPAAAAPWAPLPPVAPPAPSLEDAAATVQFMPPPPPAPVLEEPEAELGAGTMQMMVNDVNPPWAKPAAEPAPEPPRSFLPEEIRPGQLLEDTHRKGGKPVESPEPLQSWEAAAPPAPVSPTETTETMPIPSFLSAEPEAPPAPPPWLTPAAETAAPSDSLPPFMAPAVSAEPASPPWLSTAEPAAPSGGDSLPPPFMSPEPAPMPEPAPAVPSWLAPAYEPPPLPPAEPVAPPMEPEATFAAPVESAFSSPAEPSAWLAPERESLPPAEPEPVTTLPPLLPAALAVPPPEPVPTVGGVPLPLEHDASFPIANRSTQPMRPIHEAVEPSEPTPDLYVRRQAVTQEMGGNASARPVEVEPAPPVSASAPWAPLPVSAEAEPVPAEPPPPPPAPEPVPAPVPMEEPMKAAPEPALEPPAAAPSLTDAQIDAIARKIVELFGDKVLREVAWEVIPDLAEMVIKTRIAELEAESGQDAGKGSRTES
jgi:CheY-like chemotaxis protein